MKSIEGVDLPFLGRKHYVPQYGTPVHGKYCLRPFPHLQNNESIRNEVVVKTKPEVKPTSRPYGHKQKLHLAQNGSDEALYRASIKTFYPLTNENKEVHLEKQMGKKRILDSLEDQRNLIGVRSLGDKVYKYPEYATGFYHERGLVTGSSNAIKNTKKRIEKTIELKNIPIKVWREDKEKMDEKKEEEKAVMSLFDWEQTTLKEANPKWRDPDAVEPEMPSKVIDQKNAKKPAGKK